MDPSMKKAVVKFGNFVTECVKADSFHILSYAWLTLTERQQSLHYSKQSR